MPNYNWIPKSFEEFQAAAWQRRIQLGILPKQYAWLYANALKFSTFKKYDYDTRLLRRMAGDPGLFKKVHDFGVDLILHEEPHGREEFLPNYRAEAATQVALTLAALLAGIWLWSDGWHVLVVYLLPGLVFALAGAVRNAQMDDHDQDGFGQRMFEAAIWPLACAAYLLQRGR